MLPRHRKYFFNSRPQGCASGFLQACPWLFTGQAYVPTYHFIDFMALAIAYNAIKNSLKERLPDICSLTVLFHFTNWFCKAWRHFGTTNAARHSSDRDRIPCNLFAAVISHIPITNKLIQRSVATPARAE